MENKSILFIESGNFNFSEEDLQEYIGMSCNVISDFNFTDNLKTASSVLKTESSKYEVLVINPFQYIYSRDNEGKNYVSTLKDFLLEAKNYGIQKIIFSSNRETIMNLSENGFKLGDTHHAQVIKGTNYFNNLTQAIQKYTN
jgi:hypothetical protein